MGNDFPALYPYSRAEAEQYGETERWDASFRCNVQCARDIEAAIRISLLESPLPVDLTRLFTMSDRPAGGFLASAPDRLRWVGRGEPRTARGRGRVRVS